MTRIALVDPSCAAGPVKALLDGVARRLGHVPPLMRVMAHSPATLAAYVGFMSALAGGTLAPAMRERVALAVAQANDCEGCLAAHTGYARSAGLSDDEIAAARSFSSGDPDAASVLAFARDMLDTHGHLSDAQFAAAREAGLPAAALVDIAALVAINVFTNSLNSLARVAATPAASRASPDEAGAKP